jgi:hypothetical protein
MLLQVNLGAFMLDPSSSVASVAFDYVQKILEIMFIATVLSCILAVALPRLRATGCGAAPGSSSTTIPQISSMFSGSIANRQLNSLMVNMQRTFAETVSSVVVDIQARKLIVLLGLCMLPTIAKAVMGGSDPDTSNVDIRSIESFFLSTPSMLKKKGKAESKSRVYANLLYKLWIAGLSMAWMNTALGFILPSNGGSVAIPGVSAGFKPSLTFTWLRVVSTVCLALIFRALQPMFPGLRMFQGMYRTFLIVIWNGALTLVLKCKKNDYD